MNTLSRSTVVRSGMAGLFLLAGACGCGDRKLARSFPVAAHQAGGEILAKEVAAVLSGNAKALLLVPDKGAFKTPVMDAQIAAFSDGISNAGYKLVIEKAAFPESRLSKGWWSGLESAELKDALERHPGIQVVASFVGPPPAQEPMPAGIRIFCMAESASQCQPALKAGVLAAAVVDAGPIVGASADARDYKVLRAEPR